MDFNLKKSKMLRDGYTVRPLEDCNKAISTGIYSGVNVANAPSIGPIELIVIDNGNGWITQDSNDINNNTHLRSLNAKKWGRWTIIFENLSGDSFDIMEEINKLNLRINNLSSTMSSALIELESRLSTLEGKELTGSDIRVIISGTEKTLQEAITNDDFCKCEPLVPAICGTFDSGEVKCGQGIYNTKE